MHRSHRDNWMSNHIGTPGDCQDQYAVWAPGLRDKCSTNDAFNLYAMECERQEQIKTFIHSLASSDDPNDSVNQWQAAADAGFTYIDFSPAEQKYIEEEVAERWQEIHI